jgi:hypothetical protein
MPTDPPDHDLLPTPDAAKTLGVSEKYFTRLVDALGIEPARAGSKTQPRMWLRSVVESLRTGPAWDELQAAIAREQAVRAAVTELTSLHPDWRRAIAPAAAAMFQFNRYIKWAICSELHREELYRLKSRFLEVLHAEKLCTRVVLHEATDSDDPTAPVREYLAFTFMIEAREYKWHSPRKQVTWEYTLSPEEADPARPKWVANAGPKPVALEEADFVRAEAIIRVVVAGADREAEEAAKKERAEHAARMRAEGLARQAALRQTREDSESGQA